MKWACRGFVMPFFGGAGLACGCVNYLGIQGSRMLEVLAACMRLGVQAYGLKAQVGSGFRSVDFGLGLALPKTVV